MELEEFSKYLNKEVIDNYNTILLGEDKTKIYGAIIELTNYIPQSMLINKKNQLALFKNNILFLVNNIITGDFSIENIFNKTGYILKMQYRCLNILKKELKDASIDEVASIYLYFYLLIILTDESIKYCENTLKQHELAHKGIVFISNDKVDIDENKNTIEKVSTYVKKIKSVY